MVTVISERANREDHQPARAPLPKDVDFLQQLCDHLIQTAEGYDPRAEPEALLDSLTEVTVISRLVGVVALLRQQAGAVLVAAVVRSLLDNALHRRWRERTVGASSAALVSLSQERYRIEKSITDRDLIVPNLDLWLRPTEFSGSSEGIAGGGLPDANRIAQKRPEVAGVMGMNAGVAELLSSASHLNGFAGWSTVSKDSLEIGDTLSPRFRAIMVQIAGRAAVISLGRERDDKVESLLNEVCDAARKIHGFPSVPMVEGPKIKPSSALLYTGSPKWLTPTIVHEELLEDVFDAGAEFESVLDKAPTPFGSPDKIANLAYVLPYLTAFSTAQAGLMATRVRFRQPF